MNGMHLERKGLFKEMVLLSSGQLDFVLEGV
jgi:hypothetical protein